MIKRRIFFWLLFFLALFAGLYFVSPMIDRAGNDQANRNSTSTKDVIINLVDKPTEEIISDNLGAINCDESNNRFFAVMLAGDEEARPLSGIGEAKIVIEAPVVTKSINRFMAFFSCVNPKEIGSVRSARSDYIQLANWFDAIFAHWGGSHFAQDDLKKGVIDEIDALPNPFNAFYRKAGILAPHNGFTNISRLLNSAKKLNFRTSNKYVDFKRTTDNNSNRQDGTLKINYPSIYSVYFSYNSKTNLYMRFRNGKAEVDKNTGKQIGVNNVVVMEVISRQIEGQYNDLDLESGGKASVYYGGKEIIGKWKKVFGQDKWQIIDENDNEIALVNGNIWISIVEPEEGFSWKIKQ